MPLLAPGSRGKTKFTTLRSVEPLPEKPKEVSPTKKLRPSSQLLYRINSGNYVTLPHEAFLEIERA
jgi:hypothetical protein